MLNNQNGFPAHHDSAKPAGPPAAPLIAQSGGSAAAAQLPTSRLGSPSDPSDASGCQACSTTIGPASASQLCLCLSLRCHGNESHTAYISHADSRSVIF